MPRPISQRVVNLMLETENIMASRVGARSQSRVSRSFRRASLALPYYVQIYRHQRPHQFIYSLLLRTGGRSVGQGGGACVSGLQHLRVG